MKVKVLKNNLGYAEVEVDGAVFGMHPNSVPHFLEVANTL